MEVDDLVQQGRGICAETSCWSAGILSEIWQVLDLWILHDGRADQVRWPMAGLAGFRRQRLFWTFNRTASLVSLGL